MGKQRGAAGGGKAVDGAKPAPASARTSAPPPAPASAQEGESHGGGLRRFTDLVDFAPVAYFVLGRDGTILQGNQRGADLLDCPAARLRQRNFRTFVSPGSQSAFDEFLQRVFVGQTDSVCEIVLPVTPQRPQMVVQVEGAIDADGRMCSAVVIDITERKRMETTLRESEERWKFALEGAKEGVWDWNVGAGTVVYSLRWKEILGCAEEEISSAPDEWLNRIHPDDLLLSQGNLRILFDGKTQMKVAELRMRSKDGGWKWILVRGMVVSRNAAGRPLRVVGTIDDISERKSVEERLRENEERWKLALEATGLGVWDFNLLTGEAIYSNRWKEILGFAPDEIGNTSSEWMTRVHPEDMPSVMECLRQVRDGKKPSDSIEFRMQCKDGRWKWIYGTGMLVGRDANGDPVRMIGTNSDIDQRKQVEESLRNTLIELDARRRDAQSLAEAKSRFLNAASHDLRQPLYAAQLFADAIDGGRLTALQRDAMRNLRHAIGAISAQLQTLLDVSRLDMGNIQPQLREIAVGNIFAGLRSTYEPIAKKAGVLLRFSHGHGQKIHSDPVLLGRLLGNLVDNAIKFSPHGVVLVCARRGADANGLRIEVRDNGSGILPKHQEQIFEEYYQIHNPARDPVAGFGLGLPIVLRISRLLNLRFAMRTQVGRGSVFSVTFQQESTAPDSTGGDGD